MKIESLIRRAHGTVVDLDDKRYHFKPTDSDERHQAEVEVKSHIERLLGIPEGYRPLEESEQKRQKAITDTPKTSKVHAAEFTLLDGSTITLGELTSRSFKASGLDLEGWNGLSDQDLYEQLDTHLAEINAEIREKQQLQADTTKGQAAAPQPNTVAPSTGGEGDDTKQDDEGDDKGDTGKGDNGTKDAGDDQSGTGDKPTDQAKPAELDRAALAAEYERKYGKKPHHSLKAERIKKLLEDEE